MIRKKWNVIFIMGLIVIMMLGGCAAGGQATSAQSESDSEAEAGEVTATVKPENSEGIIGLLFPDKDDSSEAKEIKKLLEERNYVVDLQYAGNDGKTQADQMLEMVENKVVAMVVLPVSSEELAAPLEKADKQGIVVVSYDKVITGTDKISYYVGFDDRETGKGIASEIISRKNLDTAKKDKKSYTIEFFMGALDDYNSQLVMEGIMEVLQSYMDDGTLVCNSLRTTYEDASIAKESLEIAQQTAVNILKANYMDEPVDIMCASSDDLAGSIVAALESEGYTDEDWPIIIGEGGTKDAMERIENGKQTLTVCRFSSQLPGLCVDLLHKALQGEEPKNLSTCDNGIIEVPASYGLTKIAYKDNYKQLMEDLGM